MNFKELLLTASSLTILGSFPAHADISAQAKDIIGKEAAQYLKQHPQEFLEIIEALKSFEAQKEKNKQLAVINDNKADLFDNIQSLPVLGNPQGTQTVVLFTDPFCGYCRLFNQILDEEIEKNKNLRVLVREIAIMHPNSDLVARALIAAHELGRYSDAMKAFYTVSPDIDEAGILKIATELGFNPTTFKATMDSSSTKKALEANMTLAEKLHLEGTPTIIVENPPSMTAGAVDIATFEMLLGEEGKAQPTEENISQASQIEMTQETNKKSAQMEAVVPQETTASPTQIPQSGK